MLKRYHRGFDARKQQKTNKLVSPKTVSMPQCSVLWSLNALLSRKHRAKTARRRRVGDRTRVTTAHGCNALLSDTRAELELV